MSWVVPTPGQPWVTYGSGYYSMEWKENRRTGLVTNVSPWPSYKFGLAGTEIKHRYGWNHHPVVFAPGNPKELLMGANVLFETFTEGIHRKAISPTYAQRREARAAEIPDQPCAAHKMSTPYPRLPFRRSRTMSSGRVPMTAWCM